jgi:hypothetical protein
MGRLRVLALCNRTRNMVGPWIDAGYEAVTVDLQGADSVEPGRKHMLASVLDLKVSYVLKLRPAIIFAFPPCTDLAISGARHFRSKGLPRLIEALRLVNACRELCEASGAPYMIENPVSTLSTYWRDPDFTFDPADYALWADDPDSQAYTKKTCIWSGGGFIMPQKAPIKPVLGSKMWRLPPSKARADLRAETPKGFAAAVFAANEPFIRRQAA